MRVTHYKYSAGQISFDLIILPLIIIAFYMLFIARFPDHKPWLIFSFLSLIIIVRFIYITTSYLIPYLKGETVLKLDNDKLQLFLKGKLLLQVPRDVAYWKDIAEINFTSRAKGSPIISFIMTDKDTFGFRTRYFAADASDIYGTIMWYFRNQQNASTGQAITNGD